MLLDRYLVPLAELTISVGLPLLLTLKALQMASYELSTAHPNPASTQTSQRIVTFWLTYWLVVCLVEMAGVNGHVRCLIAVLYYAQSDATILQLLRLYEQTLLPLTCALLHRFLRSNVTEVEMDRAVGYLLERMCFDSRYFTQSLLEIAVPKGNTESRWSTPKANAPAPPPLSPEAIIEHIIPLQMSRVRSPAPEEKRPRRRSQSLQSGSSVSLGRKSSKQNLRASSWNTQGHTSIGSRTEEQDFVEYTTMSPVTTNNHRARVPSADLVFEESPERRGFRESIKEFFV